MLATDVHPNRLERARVDIMDLIGDLRGDRAGLLVFRGKANMICPLTTDYSFLRQALDGITIDAAPRGSTDLGDAIRKSLAAFETMPDENNAIILISDGDDLVGKARAAAEEAGRRGIPIFTVGIGDPNGAEVPAEDGKGAMKYHGETVRSSMTEATLSEIAKASGGAYIPLATSSTASTTLGAIYRQHLSRIAAREMEEMFERRLVERYQLFLIPAIVLLLATAALSRGRLASSTRRSAADKISPT
jgi:Ca-activated chloride channel family protein